MRELVIERLQSRTKQVISDQERERSAVLLLFVPREDGHSLLYQQRTSHVEHFKGEVSFPGGAFHTGVDTSLLQTALRETWEEMGIDPENVEVLGELDDHLTRPPYMITPFVGILRSPQNLKPAAIEVAEVLEIPLAWLRDPANLIDSEKQPRTYAGRDVRWNYYEWGDAVIWGATARMTQHLLDLLPAEFK